MSNLTLAQTKRFLEESPEDFITGYRADPENKYGGGNGLETQPTLYNKDDMNPILRAMKYLHKYYGTKHPDPQQLAAFALKEGRPDFGINGPDSPRFALSSESQKIFQKIFKDPRWQKNNDGFSMVFGQTPLYDFARALRANELMQTAERRNKPLEAVWNPGERHYVNGYNNNSNITDHSQNDMLTDHIYNGLGLPKPKLQELSAIPTPDIPDMPISLPDSYRMGGRVRMI